MKNRITAGILGVLMILYIIPPVFAIDGAITISSKEDFIAFSKKCTLDTWSQGKTVNLNCDIDFENDDFSPIATFGGTFNGNGYTICGINFSKSGSYIGVFRYLQPSGKISNLNVSATITPNGSKSFIGGIVGENHGVVELCGFEGTLKGKNVIGGIVGNNADDGHIISCSSTGSVVGENSTGGIAGKNSGFIRNCTNNSAVNTIYEEEKNDLSDIDTDKGSIIENYKNNAEETEEESVLGHSDTGGIVGYSSGVIQGCSNNADVGYKHIGYNVGGISGRQSGYMLGCKNYGTIYGRKDVGGITGQIEPYILLKVSESGLHNIRKELNKLNILVNQLITDTDSLAIDTEQHLTDISEYSKNARHYTEILLNQGTDFIDDNLGEINAQSAILSNTLDRLIPAFESLENGGENLATALDNVSEAVDNIKIYAPDLNDEIDDIKSALSYISMEEKSIKTAVSRATKAYYNLYDAIGIKNRGNVKNAILELSSAINDIIIAKQTINTALDTIENTLKNKPEDFESIGINAIKLLGSIKTIKDNVNTTISSLQTIEKSLNTVASNIEIDFSELNYAVRNIESAIWHLSTAMYYITDGIEDLGYALENMYDELKEYTDDITEDMNVAKDDLADAITSLSYTADDITTALGDIKDIISDLSNEKPLEFVKLDDDFKGASENLFNSLSDISGKINGLRDIVSSEKNTMTNNLASISNQFNLVLNLLISEFESLQNGTNNISDKFLDFSDEDIESAVQGKVEQCHNWGMVEADRNTGGISGAMAVEYAKDPEDDIEKPNTLNFTYCTKAILQGCINDGEIVGKKDCTGGIVGLSEIGTVYECENYANIKSTSGNYVGGIAGKSESTIRKSYAKSRLTGERFIGGIAGKADVITACYTIVNVKGDENTGAICGDAEDVNKLYQNFYVDNSLGAVDGISYNNKAMPIAFEELQAISGIPIKFISFTVTFKADNKIIETQDIRYGYDVRRIKYPQIPQKDGYFGNWQPVESEIITENIEILCEYQPYITILASEEKNKNGKLALALAEGEFTDSAKLHILDSKAKPPVNINTSTYDISLLNTDINNDDNVTIRILNEDKNKITAWILKNNDWEKVKVTDKGKYVVLQMQGNRNTICLSYESRNFNIIIILLILIPISLCVLWFFRRKVFKHKSNCR